MNKKRLISIVLAIIALAVTWRIISATSKQPASTPPALVSIDTIKKQDVENTLKLIGTIEPYQTVNVKARLDSQITKVAIKDGQTVEKDDILFQLDDRILQTQLAQLEATQKSNQAQLQKAQNQLTRDSNLATKGVASQRNYDDSVSAAKSAEAAIESTKAQIENIKVQLDYTTIRAPIAGRTGTIYFTVGNTVKANDTTPLVIINQIKPIKVKISVPQRYFEVVRKAINDKESSISVTNTKGEILDKGTISYKENVIDDTTRTLSLIAIAQNQEEKLWPGMFVDTIIKLGVDKDVLTVPLKSILPGQNKTHIFTVVNNKAVKKEITVHRSQDDIAIISGDIAAGDQVISDGLLRIRDGSSISINSTPKESIEKQS